MNGEEPQALGPDSPLRRQGRCWLVLSAWELTRLLLQLLSRPYLTPFACLPN